MGINFVDTSLFFEKTTPKIDSEVSRLLTVASNTYPLLKGLVGEHPCSAIKVGKNNEASITAIYRLLEAEYPEAGQPYWSMRTWTMLVRQPIYLALAGVHQLNLTPPLDAMSQTLSKSKVVGFIIPNRTFQRGDGSDIINTTSQLLKETCDALFEELSDITRIKRISAMRLVADNLLAALNRLKYSNKQMTNKEIITYSTRWLCCMGLEGQSSLMPITLSSGREQLVLNRKGCCMHYRREDGGVCVSCPKQKLPERIALMRDIYDRQTNL
jgi:siderophore ferric iron reductase